MKNLQYQLSRLNAENLLSKYYGNLEFRFFKEGVGRVENGYDDDDVVLTWSHQTDILLGTTSGLRAGTLALQSWEQTLNKLIMFF